MIDNFGKVLCDIAEYEGYIIDEDEADSLALDCYMAVENKLWNFIMKRRQDEIEEGWANEREQRKKDRALITDERRFG